jgi:hypothetical protein
VQHYQPLLDAFLHSGSQAEQRRLSLRLFLDMIAATDGHALDDESFRQLLYFGESAQGAHWRPLADLEEQAALWRTWQEREYLSLALSSIWSNDAPA